MKVTFSSKTLGVFLAINLALLPVFLFGLYHVESGLDRVLLIAMLCIVSCALFAVALAVHTIRALRAVELQVQGMSAVDLRPIALADSNVSFAEIHHLVLSLNKLLREIIGGNAARDAVMQSERLTTLGELVAGTSHELNNPLAIVTGYSDLLLEDGKLSPEQRSSVESIRRNALRASHVVHGLLTFARRRKPHRIMVDVNCIVESAIQLKEYDFRTTGIELEKVLAPDLPPIFADPHQLEQALLNVLNNAQEAVLARADRLRIAIRTLKTDEGICVSVDDTGVGIASADIKKVFDPFFTTKLVGKGTGLGLSVSYGIVREHGGDIQIQSRVGEGTQVCIEIPLGSSASNSKLEDAIPGVKMSRRYLIVDDEPEIVLILESLFSRDGNIVDTAPNLDDAFSLATKNEYDFIFADVKMPGGSGIDLYTRLRAISPSYHRRVVFLIGDTSDPSTLQFLEREGLAYFTKPFDLRTVEKFLQKSAT